MCKFVVKYITISLIFMFETFFKILLSVERFQELRSMVEDFFYTKPPMELSRGIKD